MRWTLESPADDITFRFVMNPRSGGSFSRGRRLAPSTTLGGATIVQEGAPIVPTSTVELVTRTTAERDTLNELRSAHRQVRMTDDLGRVNWVVITDIKYKPEPRTRHPGREIATLELTQLDVP